MKFNIVSIQTGPFVEGDTYEIYMNKQVELMKKAVEEKHPYLVLFPEMMTGAYFGMVTDKKWFSKAEDFETGPTTTMMIEQAKKLGVHICYSLYEKDSSGQSPIYYNTVGIVSPTRGVIGKYRKIHIPAVEDRSISKVAEKFYFSKGDNRPQLFELDNGVKVATLICYDRSFSELWRTYFLLGAQIILAATCTMGDRYDMYIPEFRTIALETHTFLAASNRAGFEQVEGEEVPRHHFGLSSVIDPIGTVLDTTDDTPWTYVCGEFDTERLTFANSRWHWRRDRRPEMYDNLTDPSYVAAPNFSYAIQ